MCAAKCRRPCLYTRSKSACRSSLTLRGKVFGACESDASTPPLVARALTIPAPCLIRKDPGYKIPGSRNRAYTTSAIFRRGETLLTEAGLYRHPLAALGAPPG